MMIFSCGTRILFTDTAVTTRLLAAVSASLTVNETPAVPFLTIERLGMSLILGAVLAAVTVSLKLADEVSVPSLTVKVTVAVPI